MLKHSQCECDPSKIKNYRYTLTVHSPGGTADAGGHVDLTDDDNWTTEGTIKANFVTKGGREYINGERVNAEVSHLLETPSNNFSRSIETSWRLTFQGRKFGILAAYDKDEMRQEVHLQVKEKV